MSDVPGDAPDHDPTGLDLARSVTAALRGLGGRLRTRRPPARPDPEAGYSGAHPDARDPARIGDEAERLISEAGWAAELAVHGVFVRWASVVGDQVAAHCAPESYQDHHLVVRTDSTAWATQLRLLAPTLIRRINEELGDGTVVRIDVRPPSVRAWSRGPRRVRGGRGPRDTYG